MTIQGVSWICVARLVCAIPSFVILSKIQDLKTKSERRLPTNQRQHVVGLNQMIKARGVVLDEP